MQLIAISQFTNFSYVSAKHLNIRLILVLHKGVCKISIHIFDYGYTRQNSANAPFFLGAYGDKLTNMLLVLMLSVSEKLESRKAVLIIQLSIDNNQLI